MVNSTSTKQSARSDGRATEIVVTCPADGRVLGRIPMQTAEDVADVARRLRAAQPEWDALGAASRAKWLSRWRDWILDNRRPLLEIVQAEGGKSWGDATIEGLAAVEAINYNAKVAPAMLRDSRPSPAGLANRLKRLKVSHRPYPLVGLITPWNYPLAMPMLDCPAALMAGCAVLSKPSEVTPLSWIAAVDGWREIGAPAVLEVVTGAGETGAVVVDAVDMVQFTGSTETGRKIGARAGERLIPASLELGGNDAMIVLADADLERAVNGAVWGGFFNAGQSCTAVERVYVESPIYERFVDALVAKTCSLRTGMDLPGGYGADFGALATEGQLAIVERHVEQARAAGARILTGGKRQDQGFLYEATVMVDVRNDMACMQEETFGPTLPVMRVTDAEEAVQMANDSTYGLSASVWSTDSAKARAVAQRLNVGAVNINSVMMNVFQFPVPQAGWLTSGVGARAGANGVLKYTRPQSMVSDLVEMESEIFWYPHTKRLGAIQERAVSVLGARDWRRRLGRTPR
jgi:acyl-CoA reductase-like NAD-dependent aldehyde dehydrogenase